MFKKKPHDESTESDHSHEKDAYEDSWYRSMKALRESQAAQDEQKADETEQRGSEV